MAYFSPDFLAFFEELAWDNSKEWFDVNRERYHAVVKDPWYAFLQLCIDEITKTERDFYLEPKNAVFRINRDIRFSKNKEPYKTNISWMLSQRWRKDMDWPWLYLQLGQSWLKFWCGTYRPPKAHLQAIRAHMIEFPRKTTNRMRDRTLLNLFGSLQWEKHKRIPKQFQPYIEKRPVLANKQFYFIAEYEPKEILRDDLLEVVLTHRDAAKWWNDFLIDAIASCPEMEG